MNTKKVLTGAAIGLGVLATTTWAVTKIAKAVKKKRNERLNKKDES